ncbi:hypothetical protein QYM36_010622 [Artemia franciscana]|uniref:guanylate cyclase n=1 Tax=Artemia franciscana TaxID=6661 RepID=A0AA88I6C0_ARTSF|nr:hypothetical protein QYM36_010622 [Artemia franciscana]
MYGLLLLNLSGYIRRTWGESAWEEIRLAAGIKEISFSSHELYPEDYIVKIANAAQKVIGIKPLSLLHGMGISFVSFVGQYGYDRVLSVLGRHLRDFLNGLDNLHEYLRPSYPFMRSPSFFCDNETPNGLTLHFRCSKRSGLVYYTMGQIKQIGLQFFKTEVGIEVVKEETFKNYNSVTFQLSFHNQGYIESQMENKFLIREEEYLPVQADFIFQTFPFSLSFDSLMKIEYLGNSLRLVLPDAKGKLMRDYFLLHRPLVEFNYETILARRNNIFELISQAAVEELRRGSSGKQSRLSNGEIMPFSKEIVHSKGNRPIHLKGQMLYLSEWNRIIYLASPVMPDLDALTDSGLFINDLSMHDFSRDLMMAGTQKSVELKLLLDQERIKSQKLQESMKKLDEEMKRTDELLYQMIPQSVADRLRLGASPLETCQSFDIVTILFSDVVQFTEISSRITPMEVVCLLNSMYSVYDQLTEIHKVYKVETVGDAYMIVGGVPEPCSDHAERVCSMGLGMLQGIRGVAEPFSASRMESNSMPMRIHVSEKTKSLLGSKFRLKERGETKIKGKGLMKTFWLEGKDEEVPMKRVMSAGQVRDNRRGYIPISSEDLLKCDRRASAPKIFKMKD